MPAKAKERFVVYARSSRWDDLASTMGQVVDCRSYGEKLSLKFSKDFREHKTGYEEALHKRTQLVMMMEYIKEHNIKIVIVRDISRLSRSVLQGCYLLHWLQRKGVVVHDIQYLNEHSEVIPSLGWDYIKALFEKLIEAENYYHTHTKDKEPKEQKGLLFNGSTSPWGYTYKGGLPAKLVKDTKRQILVKRVFELVLEYAPRAIRQTKKGQFIVYADLFREMVSDARFGGLLKKIGSEGQRKSLNTARTFKTFIQNPYYAGFANNGEQTEESRVHEAYITVKEYNQLNLGYKKIILPVNRDKTYVSLIKCACTSCNLNKQGEWVVCQKCGNRVKEEVLANDITELMQWYYLDKEHNFLDTLAQRIKIGNFNLLLSDLRDACSKYIDSDTVVLDRRALNYRADNNMEFVSHLNEFIGILDRYREINRGEMAVEWLEHYRSGDAREMLNKYELQLIYDFNQPKSGKIAITQQDKGILPAEERRQQSTDTVKYPIVLSNRKRSRKEIDDIVEERRKYRIDIQRILDSVPGIKAILEYDLGFVTGDYWTPYTDMLKP